MKFKFVKTLLTGTLFALGTLGFTACGDDSGSNSSPDSSSSGKEKLVLDSVSKVSPLSTASWIEAEAVSDGQGGYNLRLKGDISTDSDEFDTEGYDGEDRVYYNIDSLRFDIGDKDGNRVNLSVPINPGAFVNNVDMGINLAKAVNGEIKLNQDSIGFGKFTLYVTIFMSGDEEDTKQFKYSARLSTTFELQQKVIESSSSAAACTEMVADTVVLSNKVGVGGGLESFNFSTGTKDNPDVTLKIEDRTPFLEPTTGVKLGKVQTDKEKGIEDGVLPTKACLENFVVEYGGEKRAAEDGLENMAWYLVTTSSGSYPFMVDKFMAQSDGAHGDLTIIYYKKK